MCDLQSNNGNSVFDDIDLGLKSILDEPFHPFFGKYFDNTIIIRIQVFRLKKIIFNANISICTEKPKNILLKGKKNTKIVSKPQYSFVYKQ